MKQYKRTIFIGDIHGCFNEFLELLQKVNYQATEDRLISLGDLVHKGPDSAKVLEFFFNGGHEVIMGNHDYQFLQALKGNISLYKEARSILKKTIIPKEKLIKWMDSFPYFIKDSEFVAVHGGFDPGKKRYSDTNPQDMTTARYYDLRKKVLLNAKKSSSTVKPWYEVFPSKSIPRTIIFGHWAGKNVRIHKHFHCIDTGCCYGGKLTCLTLPDHQITSVESHQNRQFDYGQDRSEVIRPAQVSDAEHISSIYNFYVQTTNYSLDEAPRPIEKFQEMLASDEPCLVYEYNGKIIGFTYTSMWKVKTGYKFTRESTIYLSPGKHRQGIGTRLYSELIKISRAKGIKVLLACIALPHPQSISFHEKFGFKKVAHFDKVGFKNNQWIDVAYWQLSL